MEVYVYHCATAPEKRRFIATWSDGKKHAGLTFTRATAEDAEAAARADWDQFTGAGRKAGAAKAKAKRAAKADASPEDDALGGEAL